MAPTTPRPLHHVAVVVGDIEAAIRWYDDVLGYRVFAGPAELTLETDDRGQRRDVLGPRFRRLRIAHLSTAGGCGLELFEPIDPPFERRPEGVEFWRSGTFHFCVTDPDIEGLAARIVATGGRQLSKVWDDRPPHGLRMVYCEDPWGLVPINPHDPDWRAGTHRDVAVVRAGSEERARSLAAEAFDTTLAKPSPGGKIATPLRRHSYAVRAEVIQDQRYRSEGPAGILEPRGLRLTRADLGSSRHSWLEHRTIR